MRRLELLVDLAEGLILQGRFDETAAWLDEVRTIANEVGEARLTVRAELIMVSVDQFRAGGASSADDAILTANRAIGVLEPLHDAAGLARAWRLLMMTWANTGQLDEASMAAERVVRYAREAGDARLASRSAGAIAYIVLHGPTPVSEALPRCEGLLASVAGDRAVEALIESTIAVLLAMGGDFETARERYRQSQASLAELGAGIRSSNGSIDLSRVELLAGDLDAAERELRRDHAALLAFDETYFRSTIAAYLAEVLWLKGDLHGALEFAAEAQAIGEADDVLTQVPLRAVRAKVLATRGDADGALRLAREAVELAAGTADDELRAGALADLAEVLVMTGDQEGSGPPRGRPCRSSSGKVTSCRRGGSASSCTPLLGPDRASAGSEVRAEPAVVRVVDLEDHVRVVVGILLAKPVVVARLRAPVTHEARHLGSVRGIRARRHGHRRSRQWPTGVVMTDRELAEAGLARKPVGGNVEDGQRRTGDDRERAAVADVDVHLLAERAARAEVRAAGLLERDRDERRRRVERVRLAAVAARERTLVRDEAAGEPGAGVDRGRRIRGQEVTMARLFW